MTKFLLIALIFTGSLLGKDGADTTEANRLAKEKSPYLLQHAHNPVDWYPWGEEAFKKAKAEKKMILLSIGYSTCHWCHVMERESFVNPEIAAFLNKNFVAIKLDREERPDVDQVYMTAFQAMTGQGGGWPLNMFLTPDLKPLTGGTYFPPKDQDGRPGFQTVLQKVHAVWAEDPDEMAKNAAAGFGEMEKYFNGLHALDAQKSDLKRELITEAATQTAKLMDPVWGGVGQENKFPQVSLLRFLFQQGDEAAKKSALMTCRRMLDGGIHDQVGGGFHRYAVDKQWLVPHFEKMLYDQAQLVELYLDAWLETGEKDYAMAVRSTADYVLRDLTYAEGGFFCAQDAQSEGKEGKYFCWTLAELKKILSADDLALAQGVLGVTEKGNFYDHSDPEALDYQNVLHFKIPRAELDAEKRKKVDAILAQLASIRAKRVPPATDDKILASWNGLMIGALARAGHVLDEPRYLAAAEKAQAFIKAKLWTKEGALYHRWREGERDETRQSESYLHLLQGTRKLYEVTLDPAHLAFAIQLAEEARKLFYDEKNGGFFQGEKRADLVLRLKGQFDGALPTESSVASREYAVLAAMTGRKEFREIAEKTLRAYVPLMRESGSGMGEMMRALDFYLEKPARLVIAGEAGKKDLLVVSAGHWDPTMITLGTLGKVDEFTAGLKPIKEKATAYYCVGETCQLPVNTPEKLAALLKRMSERKAQ
ncbi:thioredoxin domain-containing protein [bacterium]|nr:thioredoxin domain-containing protein [bacterium]